MVGGFYVAAVIDHELTGHFFTRCLNTGLLWSAGRLAFDHFPITECHISIVPLPDGGVAIAMPGPRLIRFASSGEETWSYVYDSAPQGDWVTDIPAIELGGVDSDRLIVLVGTRTVVAYTVVCANPADIGDGYTLDGPVTLGLVAAGQGWHKTLMQDGNGGVIYGYGVTGTDYNFRIGCLSEILGVNWATNALNATPPLGTGRTPPPCMWTDFDGGAMMVWQNDLRETTCQSLQGQQINSSGTRMGGNSGLKYADVSPAIISSVSGSGCNSYVPNNVSIISSAPPPPPVPTPSNRTLYSTQTYPHGAWASMQPKGFAYSSTTNRVYFALCDVRFAQQDARLCSMSFDPDTGVTDVQEHGVIMPGETDIIGKLVIREQTPTIDDIEIYGLTNGPLNHIFRWSRTLAIRIQDMSALVDLNMKEVLQHLTVANMSCVHMLSDGSPYILKQGGWYGSSYMLTSEVLNGVGSLEMLLPYDGIAVSWTDSNTVNSGNGVGTWGRISGNVLSVDNPLIQNAGQARALAQAIAATRVSTTRRLREVDTGYLVQCTPQRVVSFNASTHLLNVSPTDLWAVKQMEIDVSAKTILLTVEEVGAMG